MFKLVLNVGEGMVGVNGKMLTRCLKYVGGKRYRLTPWINTIFSGVGVGVSHKNSSDS